MAPAQTLSWVIPLQTIAVVATLVGNSTEWQPKPKGNSDASTIETFVILCFIALGFGYWVGLTKRVEDAKCAGNLKAQVSEPEVSRDLEKGENESRETSSASEAT